MRNIELLAELIKSLILAFLTALFAIVAYLVINLKTLDNEQIFICAAGIFGVFVILIFLFLFFIKQINKLGER